MREPDVDRLKASITVRQARTWQAFYASNPFGSLRGDYQNAVLMRFIHQMMGGKGRIGSVEDFLTFDPQRGKRTHYTTEDAFRMLDRSIAGG